MKDDIDYREMEWFRKNRKEYLEDIISVYKKPDWFDWFWLYPAKSMVSAATAELLCMEKTECLNIERINKFS